MNSYHQFSLIQNANTLQWAVSKITVIEGKEVSGETIPLPLTEGADDFALISVFKAILHDHGKPSEALRYIEKDSRVRIRFTPGPSVSDTEKPTSPKRTKLFFDMEFEGLYQGAGPISLGIVADSGETFYAEFAGFDERTLVNGDFIRTQVIPNLLFYEVERRADDRTRHIRIKQTAFGIRESLRNWLRQFKTIEFWGDVHAYDWVLLCDIFDGAMPFSEENPQVYYIPFDLATLMYTKGVDPDINREDYGNGGLTKLYDHPTGRTLRKHNALFDAIVQFGCWQRLDDGYRRMWLEAGR